MFLWLQLLLDIDNPFINRVELLVEKLDIARGDFVDEEVPMRLVVLNR